MTQTDKIIQLIDEAITELDNSSYPFSTVITKVIRIAYLKNDNKNIPWLEEEIRNFEYYEDKRQSSEASNSLYKDIYKNKITKIKNKIFIFLSRTEQQLIYGGINTNIFEKYRQYVDQKLSLIAPEVLDQLIATYRRLSEGDSEAGSHALLSCRRILQSIADKLYPPSTEPITGSDGKKRDLTKDKYINRLWQFIEEKIAGKVSGKLLLAQLNDIGHRLDSIYKLDCKGIHSEVSEFEVNQCVIQTYLLIGDILLLVDDESIK